MLYVGNMSDLEKAATQQWECCIAKRKKGAEFGSASSCRFVRAQFRDPLQRVVLFFLRFLVSVPDTVGFKAQIGC